MCSTQDSVKRVGWWNNTANLSCTTENMMTVLNGTLGTVPRGFSVMDNKTRKAISGLVRIFSYMIRVSISFLLKHNIRSWDF